MELYARVRRAVVVDRMSEREAARQFGLARETVRKMPRYAVPPGYRRQQPVRRPNAMLSRYSRVRMEAKRRALDEIAARQRAADEKRREETERRVQAAAVPPYLRRRD